MEETEVPDAFLVLPLGGTREIGSHKGYSLAVMVDILCGMVSTGLIGAATGVDIASTSGGSNESVAFLIVLATTLLQGTVRQQ